jgi:hypothetical protein
MDERVPSDVDALIALSFGPAGIHAHVSQEDRSSPQSLESVPADSTYGTIHRISSRNCPGETFLRESDDFIVFTGINPNDLEPLSDTFIVLSRVQEIASVSGHERWGSIHCS